MGPERSLARVCREAGATVRTNTKLRDMNVCVPANDQRAIEVLASGLPLHYGAQLAVPLPRAGVRGRIHPIRTVAILTVARNDKERKYHELLASDRCHLIVLAMETGGRWSGESVEFITNLANAKAREAPRQFKVPLFHAWRRRWTSMLAVSGWRAFSSSLVSSRSEGPDGQDGHPPDLADLFGAV